MNRFSMLLLSLSLVLAVVFGAQTVSWSWGPALVTLALALFSTVCIRPSAGLPWIIGLPIFVASGWILWRCSQSPVIDAARSDALLCSVVLVSAWITMAASIGRRAMLIFYLGLAAVCLANECMAILQWRTPDLMWPYANKPAHSPTGFFGHYNYFSNFVIGCSLLCLARGLFAQDPKWARLLLVLPMVGALVSVPLSGSRGGTVALATGILVFMIASGVLAKRNKSKWVAVYLVSLPILLIASVGVGWYILRDVQERRTDHKQPMSIMLDNSARLMWMKLAVGTIQEHPFQGGGSRSFSWERNQKWDVNHFGRGKENERFVHNEMVQLATDYGLIGVALVSLSLGGAAWVVMARLFVGGEDKGNDSTKDATAVGVASAGFAMLTQANFSFVFHLLPSTMLLGMLFGLAASTHQREHFSSKRFNLMAKVPVVIFSVVLGWFGVRASLALRNLWPVLYSEEALLATNPSQGLQSLREAARFWPGYRIFEEQGKLARTAAVDLAEPEYNTEAVAAYREAARLHPLHAGLLVNAGNAESDLGNVSQAEELLTRAIKLQGGLEAAFRARLCLAGHLYRTWQVRWKTDRRAEEALHEFLRARDLLDQSDAETVHGFDDSKALRKSLDEVIGFLEGGRVTPRPPEPEED